MLTPAASLLAFIGTGLTAIAVFAPRRAPSATVSFAPALDPPAFDRCVPPAATSDAEPARSCAPGWPALVDPSTDGGDVAVRLALVGALSELATPWADAILRRALDEEADPQVRAAAGAAMRDAG